LFRLVARRPAVAHALVPSLLTLVTFLAFSRSLANGFVNWDDDQLFIQNAAHRGPLVPGLLYAWQTRILGEYMPVTWTSYALDHAVWGLRPFGYHLSSLLCHVAAVLCVYVLARRLLAAGLNDGRTTASESSDRALDGVVALGAAVTALVFGLHPLRVEPVAWVAARGTVLGGLLLILTTLTYVGAATRAACGTTIGSVPLAGVAVLFVLSMLARATGLVLPLVLLILDIYPLRRLGGDAGWIGSRVRGVWFEKGVLGILGLLAVPIGMIARAGSGRDPFVVDGYDPSRAVATALHGAALYVTKTLWPLDLSPVYRFPARDDPRTGWVVASAVLLSALTILAVALRRRWPAVLAAWVTYLVLIAPTSGLVPHGRLRGAVDRYTYVACLGWAMLAGAAVAAAWLRRRRDSASQLLARAGLGTLGIVLATWVAIGWRQLDVWRDGVHLWERAVAITPGSWPAHNNLGVALEQAGDLAAAGREFGLAARGWGNLPGPYLNLGRVLAAQGRLEESAQAFRTAVALVPDDAPTRVYLGMVLCALRARRAGLAELETAVALAPDLPLAHYQLGLALEQEGRREEAVRHLTRALQAQPEHAEARRALTRLVQNASPVEALAPAP
jgi:tetratricopeptide (TPR) repeat protein